MEVSNTFCKCTYCIFTLWGRISKDDKAFILQQSKQRGSNNLKFTLLLKKTKIKADLGTQISLKHNYVLHNTICDNIKINELF